MNKSKKIILISLLPALLTLIFIAYVVMPAIADLNETKNNLETEKAALAETQEKLILLKENSKLSKDVQKLKDKVFDFNVQVPPKDEIAVLLVDVGKFANDSNVKILSLNSETEKSLEIETPKINKNKIETEKNKKVSNPPVLFSEIPLKLSVVGCYSDVLNFINEIENYQRKITITGISVSNYSKNKNIAKPEIEIVIDCLIYRLSEKEIDKGDKLQ